MRTNLGTGGRDIVWVRERELVGVCGLCVYVGGGTGRGVEEKWRRSGGGEVGREGER
jgi:hypothetical protein